MRISDWSSDVCSSDLRQARDSRPLILAGGLKPETLAQLVRQVRPYAVDVSSGVESAPGIKSADNINAFMQALQASAGLIGFRGRPLQQPAGKIGRASCRERGCKYG